MAQFGNNLDFAIVQFDTKGKGASEDKCFDVLSARIFIAW